MATARITPDSLLVGNAIGWHEGERTITVSFVTQVPGYYAKVDTDGDGRTDSFLITAGDDGEPDFTVPFGASVAMDREETRLARLALQEWAGIANLNLVEVKPGPGVKATDVTLGSFTFEDRNTFGFVADFPEGLLTGKPAKLGVPSVHGDFWINTGNPDQVGAAYGNTAWQTYLHELGHAFGLHHPDDEGEPDRPIPFHNNRYTVMSYVPHPGMDGLATEAQDWPITPMMYDIAAIQTLYGANLATRAGDTTYFGANGSYALKDGGLLATGRTAILTVWDAGGIDTLDASNQTGSVTINLNPGTFSTIGEVADNIGLSMAHVVDGVVVNLIENARGGRAADSLTGNVGNNVLDGGAGADTMRGGKGNDTYAVDTRKDQVFEAKGQGKDTVVTSVSYALADGQEIEILQLAAGTGKAALHLTGNAFANTLLGNGGANTLAGGAGNDLLTGRGGADTFVFSTKLGSGNVDRIADFAADDTIRLDDAVFATIETGILSAGAFKAVGKAKLDPDDRILYKQASGELFYDADGSGRAGAVLFATLDNGTALTAADFLVA